MARETLADLKRERDDARADALRSQAEVIRLQTLLTLVMTALRAADADA
jgi:hypothetical protein